MRASLAIKAQNFWMEAARTIITGERGKSGREKSKRLENDKCHVQ